MQSKGLEKGEETPMITQKCYLNMRYSLVPSVGKHSNGLLRMHWGILDGL